jgi:hypothetical protein
VRNASPGRNRPQKGQAEKRVPVLEFIKELLVANLSKERMRNDRSFADYSAI